MAFQDQTYNPGETQRTVHNKIPMKAKIRKRFLDAMIRSIAFVLVFEN
jgi:hypothetical protein